MRKLNMWMGASFWAAIAVLMPMTALEPVPAAHAAPAAVAVVALSSCADGSTRLAMGCESIHL
jgi:hypothetical protein